MPRSFQTIVSLVVLLVFTAIAHAQDPLPVNTLTTAPTDTSTTTTTPAPVPAAPNGVVAPPAAGPNAPTDTAPAAPANGVVTQFIMTTGPGGVPQSIPTIVTLSTAAGSGNAFGEPMSGSVGLGTLTGSVGAIKTGTSGGDRINVKGLGLWIVLGGMGARFI